MEPFAFFTPFWWPVSGPWHFSHEHFCLTCFNSQMFARPCIDSFKGVNSVKIWYRSFYWPRLIYMKNTPAPYFAFIRFL